MRKKEPLGEERCGPQLILMQETAAMHAGHAYPQHEHSASSGTDMVTPQRAPRKKFWQVGCSEHGEEVDRLMEQSDHDPSEQGPESLHTGDAALAHSRGGSLWKSVASCMHESCNNIDEHSTAYMLGQELCGRWRSPQTMRASLLVAVLLLILLCMCMALNMSRSVLISCVSDNQK